MGSNSFGQLFRITTWGESHGKAIGVVIDGCPAGLAISEEEINRELEKRRPGTSAYTSPRKEPDCVEILSGLFDGKTTGAPLSLIIYNKDFDSSKYDTIQNMLRPGHANFTYLEKYGIYDHRGGGRASARETACRVAAGAIAKKLLAHYGIELIAYIKEVGGIEAKMNEFKVADLKELRAKSEIFCLDQTSEKKMIVKIEQTRAQRDSLGGVVELIANPMPTALGEPLYQKLEAHLASAMLSIPAAKGFEMGSGFTGSRMKGSEHNDAFETIGDKIVTKTNHAGGTLGGISNGMPLILRVAFKPTSSIGKTSQTVDLKGNPQNLSLPEGSRHDPCLTIRAVPVVEAMTALTLADQLLLSHARKPLQ